MVFTIFVPPADLRIYGSGRTHESAIISSFIVMSSRFTSTEMAKIEARLKKTLGRDLTSEESKLLGLSIPALRTEESDEDSPEAGETRKKA